MRQIDPNIIEAASSQVSYPIDFVSFIVNSSDPTKNLFVSNGFRDFTFGGNTYAAGQSLLDIGSVDETTDVKTNSINISVAGVDKNILAAFANVETTGTLVTLYRGYFNTDTQELVADPYIRWEGVMNDYAFAEDPSRQGSITVSASCKNIVAALLETSNGRYTSLASFQQINSTDKSMEFVEGLAEWNPSFGRE